MNNVLMLMVMVEEKNVYVFDCTPRYLFGVDMRPLTSCASILQYGIDCNLY